MKARGLAPVALLAGCASLSPAMPFEARVVGHSLYCNTPGAGAAVAWLADAAALRQWQAGRGVALFDPAGEPGPFVVVEMGPRPTGGYDLTVSSNASKRGDTISLQAEFSGPPPGSLRTQALSSPCVLVQLPPGDYATIEVRDPGGALLAKGVGRDGHP